MILHTHDNKNNLLNKYMDFDLFLFYIVNDVDMKTLPCLTENMIKELIPVIGHRARFLSNLEQWKLIIQGSMPNVNNYIPN